jgi:cation diffusion facilitator CzcD-associated flavoprotein CzcO
MQKLTVTSGCACDIPSANYQFTWARNPNWSQFYSSSPEIWRYMRDVAVKHDLMRYMNFNSEVFGAHWDPEAGKWHVTIKNTRTGEEFTDTCDVLLNGSGVLK